MPTRRWRGKEKMKKLFVIVSLLVLFTFYICSEETKFPSFVETSIGKFILESEAIYTCVIENDGKEIVLNLLFERDCTKSEIKKEIADLVEKYLKLPKTENQICLYAAENAASGKYKDIISKSGRIYGIMVYKNGEESILEYDLITEEQIRGCDFIVVRYDNKGNPEGAYLVGWQD